MASSAKLLGIPFDAKLVGGTWDRTYISKEVAEYAGSMFSDGILVKTAQGETLTNQLKVNISGTKAQVLPGKIITRGRLGELVSSVNLDIANNTTANDRTDLIVVEMSTVEARRDFEVKVIAGGSPSSLTRTADIWQMLLATVVVAKNSAMLKNLIDKRADETACGVAKVVLGAKTISGIDEIRLVATEPTDSASQAEPRVLFLWGE